MKSAPTLKSIRAAPLSLSAALLLVACGGDDDAGNASVAPATNEIGPVHVHGLGVNPADQTLFVATHTGLWQLADGEDELTLVGDTYQDTMGFTVIGSDRFLGSGHPDARTDLPPYLGLIRTVDAGESWKPVSLLGQVDFHVLESSGSRIYGFGSDFRTRTERFMVSDDHGRAWRDLPTPEAVLSLAIDPEDPDRLLISGRRSLYQSADGGLTWETIDGDPGLVAWPTARLRYLISGEGSVFVDDMEEGGWSRVGESGGEPAAFEADGADQLYAALHDGTIIGSDDGGSSWRALSSPG